MKRVQQLKTLGNAVNAARVTAMAVTAVNALAKHVKRHREMTTKPMPALLRQPFPPPSLLPKWQAKTVPLHVLTLNAPSKPQQQLPKCHRAVHTPPLWPLIQPRHPRSHRPPPR